MCKSAYCHRLCVTSQHISSPSRARPKSRTVTFVFVRQPTADRSVTRCERAMLRTHRRQQQKIVNRIWTSTIECVECERCWASVSHICRTNEQIALTIKILRNTPPHSHMISYFCPLSSGCRLSGGVCALLLPLLVNAFLFVDSQLGRAVCALVNEYFLLISLHWDEISGMRSLTWETANHSRRLVHWNWFSGGLSMGHDLVCCDHVTPISLLDCQVYCNSKSFARHAIGARVRARW